MTRHATAAFTRDLRGMARARLHEHEVPRGNPPRHSSCRLNNTPAEGFPRTEKEGLVAMAIAEILRGILSRRNRCVIIGTNAYAGRASVDTGARSSYGR